MKAWKSDEHQKTIILDTSINMLKGEKSSSKAFQKVELRMEKINIFSLVIFPFFVQANGRLKTSPPQDKGIRRSRENFFRHILYRK